MSINNITTYKTKKNILKYFMILYTVCIISLSSAQALISNSMPVADFNMIYLDNDRSYIVNNSVLPDNIGSNLPYSIHCTNLSKGASTFDWQVRTPGHDYMHVDNTPNPIIKISNYGPTYVKLIINGNDSLYKEYCVTTKEYGFTSNIENITNNTANSASNDDYSNINKTLVKTSYTYISPNSEIPNISKKVPYDKNYAEKSDFKISYTDENKFYNVTNSAIPNTIPSLPYKVTLTNITDANTELVWYIKLPDANDYTWMSNKQIAEATIFKYGTVQFKLVLNNKESSETEYSVTAFPPEKRLELKKFIKNVTNKVLVEPNFKVIYLTDQNSVYDVTNSVIPDTTTRFPYKISLINLSLGEKSYDWSIKIPGSSEYTPLKDPTATISCYGAVSIKLRLNGNDSLSKENSIVSYFSANNSNISNNNYQVNISPENATANFKILVNDDDKWHDATNSQIVKESLNSPQTIYLSNLSTGNIRNEWFIKLPGGQYIPFDNVPNPVAIDWQPGIVHFKLRINGDERKTKEYSVKVCTKIGTPNISSPEDGKTIEMGDLEIKWDEFNKDFSYVLTLINETRKKPVIIDRLIQNQNFELIPSKLIEEGCQYSVKVRCVESELESNSVFYSSGTLDLHQKPVGGISTPETAVSIQSANNVLSLLNNLSPVNYFKFDNTTNSELSIMLESAENIGISLDLLNENYNIEGKASQDKDGNLTFSRVLRQGIYYIKVYSNENISNKEVKYNLNLKTNQYNPKAVLLYVGYGFRGDRNSKYPVYSDSDLEKLLNNGENSLNTNEFIINTSCDSYGAHQAIPNELQEKLINSVKIEDWLETDTLEKIKVQLRHLLNEYVDSAEDGVKQKSTTFVPYHMTLDSFANDSLDLAVRLIQKDPSVKIWFTFPLPISSNLIDHYTQIYKEKIVDGIKSKLDDINPDYWRNNVVGFYYAHEDVPIGYTVFEKKDNAYLQTNPVVKSMGQLADIVHNRENKLFMWIPCSQSNTVNIERIGYIANTTDFFDYCIIQPNRIFSSSEYISKGTGDDEIQILNDVPEAGKEIRVRVNCQSGQSLKVTVLDGSKWVAYKNEVNGESTLEFTFKPWRELYTIIATVNDNGESKTFFKTIFLNHLGRTDLNIPTILKSVRENCVYYPGTNGMNGKSVLTKSSKTKIGVEMEIDGYCNLDYKKIDFADSELASLKNVDAVAELSNEIKDSIVVARTTELNNYFRYIVAKKSIWFKEYLKAFKRYKNSVPIAFYVGDRNEFFDGTTDDFMYMTDEVFNSVSKFFRND